MVGRHASFPIRRSVKVLFMNLLIGSKVLLQRKQSNINETIKLFFEWSTKSSFWTLCQLCCNFGPSNNVIYFFCQTTAYKDKSRNIHDCTFFRLNFSLKSFVVIQAWLTFFFQPFKEGLVPSSGVLVQPACLLSKIQQTKIAITKI